MIPVARIAAFTLMSGGLALGTIAVAQSATASPLNIVDNGDGTATGYWKLPSAGTWPQSAINPGALCGLVQADVYPYASDADKARTDALTADSTLTEGEDYGWPTSWTIKEYPACATTPSSTPSPTSTPTPGTTSPAPSAPVESPAPSPSPTVSVPVVTDQPSSSPTPSPEASSPSTKPTKPASTTSSPTPSSLTLTATSTPTSTPVAAGSNRNGTGTTEAQINGSTELAYTGTNTGPAIGGAFALLVGGLVMLALGKKRRA